MVFLIAIPIAEIEPRGSVQPPDFDRKTTWLSIAKRITAQPRIGERLSGVPRNTSVKSSTQTGSRHMKTDALAAEMLPAKLENFRSYPIKTQDT
ncbi:hypothetical protein [Sinorhizobium sp. Sb3]|uniref:hypothetical protein n=1 Tax=Sinorhizobium/Ensifer group TaxID=227292 RepID=UPI0012E352DB|nr:hypothetical protein [Sinorhizobium sp. Sb3]